MKKHILNLLVGSAAFIIPATIVFCLGKNLIYIIPIIFSIIVAYRIGNFINSYFKNVIFQTEIVDPEITKKLSKYKNLYTKFIYRVQKDIKGTLYHQLLPYDSFNNIYEKEWIEANDSMVIILEPIFKAEKDMKKLLE